MITKEQVANKRTPFEVIDDGGAIYNVIWVSIPDRIGIPLEFTVSGQNGVTVLKEGEFYKRFTLFERLPPAIVLAAPAPFISAPVQYIEDGQAPIGFIRAAIVTRVDRSRIGVVDLIVFKPGHTPQHLRCIEHGGKVGQWRWPIEDK